MLEKEREREREREREMVPLFPLPFYRPKRLIAGRCDTRTYTSSRIISLCACLCVCALQRPGRYLHSLNDRSTSFIINYLSALLCVCLQPSSRWTPSTTRSCSTSSGRPITMATSPPSTFTLTPFPKVTALAALAEEEAAAEEEEEEEASLLPRAATCPSGSRTTCTRPSC